MITKEEITGLVLAGGEGRRVGGSDKGLLDFNGCRLIEHQIAWLKPQVNNLLISANRNISTYQSFGYPVISDQTESAQGPLQGLLKALEQCTTRYLYVHPIDVPNLPADTISRLSCMIEKHEQKESNNRVNDYLQKSISLPVTQMTQNAYYLKSSSRGHFLSMLIKVDQLEKLRDFMGNNNKRVGLFHQLIQSRPIDLGLTEDKYKNLNFSSDYE
jgi:molybdenum cofactor guanylyltransferase